MRVNLRLCINRLKLLEKKKSKLINHFEGDNFNIIASAEGAMKARREIADYLKNKRTERARIRVSGYSVNTIFACYFACQTLDPLKTGYFGIARLSAHSVEHHRLT